MFIRPIRFFGKKKNLLECGRKQDIAFGGESKLFCLGVVRENRIEPKIKTAVLSSWIESVSGIAVCCGRGYIWEW